MTINCDALIVVLPLSVKNNKGRKRTMADNAPLYLSDEYIKSNKLLQFGKLIPAIQNAMASVSNNSDEVIQPPRTLMHIPSLNG
jgi:hypothetical protein